MQVQNIWFHVDMTNPGYAGLRNALEGLFNANKPGGVSQLLSINENNANTQAVIKVVTPLWWIIKGESAAIRSNPATIAWYTKHEIDQVKALVNDAVWTG